MNPGDIVFYQGNIRNPIDMVIMAREHFKIVHVAIVVPSESKVSANTPALIAATSHGIDYQEVGDYYAVWKTGAKLDEKRLASALTWLAAQIGKPYGWGDIANQVLEMLGDDEVLIDKSYDCSHLATSFLWLAGYELPATMLQQNLVTPGSLFIYAKSVGPLIAAHPSGETKQ